MPRCGRSAGPAPLGRTQRGARIAILIRDTQVHWPISYTRPIWQTFVVWPVCTGRAVPVTSSPSHCADVGVDVEPASLVAGRRPCIPNRTTEMPPWSRPRARPATVFLYDQGSWLWDDRGRLDLDFIQGWAVNTVCRAPDAVREALAQQSALLLTPSPAFNVWGLVASYPSFKKLSERRRWMLRGAPQFLHQRLRLDAGLPIGAVDEICRGGRQVAWAVRLQLVRIRLALYKPAGHDRHAHSRCGASRHCSTGAKRRHPCTGNAS